MTSNKSAASFYRQRAAERGFTLIELLVVIAIIAVLIGMLMPAINAAREMARRANCSTNMHNVVVAIANYASAQGGDALPQGIDATNHTSGLTLLLPYMEGNNLFKQYNIAAPADQSTVTTFRIPVLVCPSDNQSSFFTSAGGGKYAQSNVALCFGNTNLGSTSITQIGAFKVGAGPGTNNGSFAAMTDGTSITQMVSEICSEKDGTTSTKFNGAWGYGEAGAMAYTTSGAPNAAVYPALTTSTTTQSTAATLAGFASANAGASSRHPGGVNVGFGDLHIMFETNISATWGAEGTASGGENGYTNTSQ